MNFSVNIIFNSFVFSEKKIGYKLMKSSKGANPSTENSSKKKGQNYN